MIVENIGFYLYIPHSQILRCKILSFVTAVDDKKKTKSGLTVKRCLRSTKIVFLGEAPRP